MSIGRRMERIHGGHKMNHRSLSLIVLLFAATGLYAQTADPPNGSGTSSDPYQIATSENLYWLSQNPDEWDKYFIQTADIDASATEQWDEGRGWTPIGNGVNPFSGSYDGQNHSIDNLFINRAEPFQGDYIAFFGYTSSAVIKNLMLLDVDVTGGNEVGALIGWDDYSTVTNCGVSGRVTGIFDEFNGNYAIDVGGLVGYSYGSYIQECWSACTVKGRTYVGGLIGFADGGTYISCFSTMSVEGKNPVGGLIGASYDGSIIENCYSKASVSSSYSAGGLIGISSVLGRIRYCYSIGQVTGDYNVGGLIASKNSNVSVSNCFWDTETSGLTYSDGGEGKTTAEMKTIDTYLNAGWDFIGESSNGTDDYWNIQPLFNSGYPFLSYQQFDPPIAAELTSLSARLEGGAALIEWTTASSPNSAGFILERSQDNLGPWREIASFQNDLTLRCREGGHGEEIYRYVDASIQEGETYWYRISKISLDGGITRYPAVLLSRAQADLAPSQFILFPAFPNPFNAATMITFDLPQDGPVTLSIFDARGRQVQTLVDGQVTAGRHRLTWDASLLPAGIYLIRLQTPGSMASQRAVLVK